MEDIEEILKACADQINRGIRAARADLERRYGCNIMINSLTNPNNKQRDE